MDEQDQQAEPVGMFWGLLMIAYAAGIGFLLMVAIPVMSIRDLIALGLERLKDKS
jgi:hypothetical protein